MLIELKIRIKVKSIFIGGVGGSVARNAPHLSLPGKLVFPSSHSTGHFSMLGLGDIVMPGQCPLSCVHDMTSFH